MYDGEPLVWAEGEGAHTEHCHVRHPHPRHLVVGMDKDMEGVQKVEVVEERSGEMLDVENWTEEVFC